MWSKSYSFGGTVFKINSPEEILETEYTEPFLCEGEAEPDFMINAAYSDEICKSGYSSAELFDDKANVYFAEKYRGKISAKNALEKSEIFRMLARRGGVVLHSSYVLTKQGDAVLFSAPSGTGKSTQAKLWEEFAGAETINGDRALVAADGDKITANGILFCGTSGICKNKTAPLKAIVLLRQSDRNELHIASGKEAFMRLLPQCSYYPEEAESLRLTTEILAKVISAVAVYDFGCVPDKSAVDALNEVLYGK